MAMARYIVALQRMDDPTCRVNISVRRDSDDRAIVYAQNWLHKHRLSFRHMGFSFDQWSVVRPDGDGNPIEIATGIDALPVPPASARSTAVKPKATRIKPRGHIESLRAIERRFGRSTMDRPMSRLQMAVAQAKAKAADDGNVSPVGSNTHRKE